jgi:hypothetical protein
LLLPPLLLL